MSVLATLKRVLPGLANHTRYLSYSAKPKGFLLKFGNAKNFSLAQARVGFQSQARLLSTARSSVIENVTANNDMIKVQWKNGDQAEFHGIWLRDHCLCQECLNPQTHQREVDVLHIPLDISPREVKVAQGGLELTWQDGHTTVYDGSWLAKHAYSTYNKEKEASDIFVWDKKAITNAVLPNFAYQNVISSEKDLFQLSHAIIKYGFAFVNETPTDVKAVETMANHLGGFVRETHYGRLWAFSNEVLEHADTAYTSDFLHAHTDTTYFNCPAGLQMLYCVAHDGKGGESLLVDGFNAANQLKQKNPEAFEFLSTKILPFRYNDDVRQLKAHGPTIELHPFTKELMQIRYNHYDRDILDCLEQDEVTEYYKSIQAYAAILRDPESEYWFKLVPGKLMVMGNWRVMHGRAGFTGRRLMHGCYAEKDYFFGQYWPLLEKYGSEL